MTDRADIVVIGAGAAGLMASIFAAREGEGLRVVAVDGAKRIGAKILISGGGRCNVTHHAVDAADFAGSSRNAIAKVLRTFSVAETVAFFEELGVRLKREETGKLFPVSDRANTVLEALLGAAAEAGAEVRSGWRAVALRRAGDRLEVEGSGGTILARRVILATGGRSVPKTGSDGAGYELARALGHRVTPTFPALVPLVLPAGHWMTALRGTSVEVELALRGPSGRVLRRHRGSMLFTHFGVSGPVVLDLSRHWIAARQEDPSVRLTASLLPGASAETVDGAIVEASREHPRLTVGRWLGRRLPDRLAEALAGYEAGVEASRPLGRLDRRARRALAHALVGIDIPAVRERGWDYAEATAGGVPLSEVDLATMRSRVEPRLHLCGEILDVDGRIGGFNFQWAWASGRLAGRGAARATIDEVAS